MKLANAAYKSNWTEYDNSYRRATILIIQRSQKPLLFRAGLYPMNLDTFIMVNMNNIFRLLII